ncbi:uncharacterized protein HMPREF1541_06320 [Cyphellophora europaea CBS 101466]|uniref:peptidylprolyl isomerase n=1 Tax=Cyphellophora europaea (strain CBS 101466) TaxID=1220924 RepID=W2RRD0_CYPE1|nr:uncharacterized protein HMPREF1541_06320 [Cyphellophora europaea CBS 101466]ETN38289.1 hypothetical protein HMPREF1541_06320 [Cyphellophora europaea CBS 101466]
MHSLSALLSLVALTTLASASNLEIDYLTPEITCDRKTKNGDQISMHYKGTLYETGEQFDASYGRGRPLDFKLGSGQVIKGWDQGLQDMCIGEKRRLTIAPELAYGERAVGPIPANSILVFETELVGIKGVEAPKKAEL